MHVIAPSILSADFARLRDEIQAVEAAGADWIHVDVMDGRFVPNLTIGPPVIRRIRAVTKLPLDVHLMIEEPERTIQEYRDSGADWISVHAEATRHLQRTLAQIKESGAKPSVALNPATPLYVLDHVWDDVEMVLLMTVNPGFGGQKFIPEMMQKVRNLRKKSERLAPDLRIEVDGGVGLENIAALSEAGATIFVAGSAIFDSKNYAETIKRMKEALRSAKS
ncbi:MAG TPA: ribulose-phosphate 3-epimerase [Bdellovibrionota bacterium]|nr:ribulose-phosphate 3-epimerase [Bdellovibrionota bacterium]